MKDLAFVRLLRHIFSVAITITVCIVALPRMMQAETAATSTVPCPATADAVVVDNNPDMVDSTDVATETPVSTDQTESSESAGTDVATETNFDSSNQVGETVEVAGSAKIRLSEVLPNPTGVDTEGEFIELRNIGNAAGQLRGWRIESDRAKSYIFGDVMVDAGAFHSFPYSLTKLTLVNDAMTLTLYDDQNVVVDSVRYPAPVPDGKSYGFDDASGGWLWNATSTPGAANAATAPIVVVSSIASTVAVANTNDDDAVSGATTALAIATTATTNAAKKSVSSKLSAAAVALAAAKKRESLLVAAAMKSVTSVTATKNQSDTVKIELMPSRRAALSDIDGIEDGGEVEIEGVVTLPTGRVGKSIFAVQDDTAAVFVRVYGSPLPMIESGVRVAVTGTLVRSGDDVTVKTSPKKINVLGPSNISYASRGVDEVDRDDAGRAIVLTGTLAAKGGSWVTIATDDASAEIKAVMPKGIAVGEGKAGDQAEVRGVVRIVSGVPQVFVLEKSGIALSPKIEEKALAESRTVVEESHAGNSAQNSEQQTILIAGARSMVPWYAPAGFVAALGTGAGYLFWRRYHDPIVRTEALFDTDLV